MHISLNIKMTWAVKVENGDLYQKEKWLQSMQFVIIIYFTYLLLQKTTWIIECNTHTYPHTTHKKTESSAQ